MKNMFNYLRIFISYLCLEVLTLTTVFSQELLLPTHHYKYQLTHSICEKIARVRDFERPIPELKMFSTKSKTQVIAQFVALDRTQVIYVDEKLYDICTKFGADSLNALACIIGHELAHYTQNHQFREGFFAGLMPSNSFGVPKNMRKSSKEHKLKLEEEADYYGLLQGYLAGFDTYRLLPKVLSKIYEEYKLNESLDGYPTKIERISSAELTAKEIKELVPVFHAGKYLYLSKNYEDAMVCFEHINNSFTDRDIANNLGVSALAQAISLMNKEDVYFAYPCEFDAAGRLLGSNPRSLTGDTKKDKKQQIKDLLKKAQQNLEQVIKMDKSYASAHINLACKYSLEGNHAFAIGLINDLETKIADNPMSKDGLPANAHLIRGIAFAKNNQLDQAKADFEAANQKEAYMADYNLALYHKLNQSFFEKLLDMSNLSEWVTDFMAENKKDKSKFVSANNVEKINQLTAQQLVKEQFVENTPIQSKERAVHIATSNSAGFDKIKIRLYDKNIYLLVAGLSYKGKTSQGLSIGSDKEKLIAAYGNPSYIKAGSNAEFYFYEKAKMIVEVSEGKIKNWTLYYIEIRN
jgi:tetratricopeptide (TPR) repeat protein